MVTGRIISNSNSKVYIMNKINLLQNVLSLQTRVNNLDTEQKKTSYARFKVKQRNIFGLALVDTGNLVHASIVSGVLGCNRRKDKQNHGLQSRDG